MCEYAFGGRTDVKGEIEKLTGLRAMVANDANAAALGEKWQGGGKGHESPYYGYSWNGSRRWCYYRWQDNCRLQRSGRRDRPYLCQPNEEASCNCGKKGCLEQYASATGIVRLAKMEMIEGKSSTILADIDGFSAKDGA